MIFTGLYSHTIDRKNRLFLPAKICRGKKKFILTPGLDGCLYLYPIDIWKKLTQKLENLSLANKGEERAFKRAFLSGAVEIEVDSFGRILIPQKLKRDMAIYRRTIIAGVGNRLEIWAEERWQRYFRRSKNILKKITAKLEI